MAAIIAANVFCLLMWSLFSRPGGTGIGPIPGYVWWVAFTVLATTSSVAAAMAHGRPVPGVSVVADLAMWGLLPITVYAAVWLTLLYTVFVVVVIIFLAAPLVLSYAARSVIRRGRVARGTGLLLVGLIYTIGGMALLAAVLPLATWLPVMLWHLSLTLAAVVALRRDVRRGLA